MTLYDEVVLSESLRNRIHMQFDLNMQIMVRGNQL